MKDATPRIKRFSCRIEEMRALLPMKRIVDYALTRKAIFDKSDSGIEFLIVGLEGVSARLTGGYAKNQDLPNHWNDTIIVLLKDGNTLFKAAATTEPGRYYTNNPMNPLGAARVVQNTFYPQLWKFGRHQGYPALVQDGEIKVARDKNKDYARAGDIIDQGNEFGINLHHGNDNPTIGLYSAGCQVIQKKRDFKALLALLQDLKPTSGLFSYILFEGSLFCGQ